jgi:hypothetical protein
LELFARVGTVPAEILRLGIRTQRADPWRKLEPVDRSGAVDMLNIAVTADGHSYRHSYLRNLSELHVVTGLK